MLGLYFLGSALEPIWGSRRFLRIYLYAGLFGALFVICFAFLLGRETQITVGASGALLGLTAAFGLLAPNQVILMGFFAPVRAKYVVLIVLGVTLLYALADAGGVSWSAHLGGLFGGAFMVRQWWRIPRLRYDAKLAWRGLASMFPRRATSPTTGPDRLRQRADVEVVRRDDGLFELRPKSGKGGRSGRDPDETVH